MKRTVLGLTAAGAIAFALQSVPAQTPAESVKARGCLQGNGSKENPWSLRGVVLPPPPSVAPAAAQGARGDGAGRGAGGRGTGPGAAPADGGRGTAGGRGDGGGRGAAPAAPAPAPPPQPPIDLRLTGIDMSPWRNMFVEVEGTLGPRPASGLRDFQVSFARSAYGECR